MTDAGATSRILTLVFTDLANSTALKTQHGDQTAGDLIERHRAHVSRLAFDTGGRIIDWAGDGCFMTFPAPSAAVLFALRLQQQHKTETDLPGVRVGLHMGEVSERVGPDGDAARPRVEGLAVDLAARICALAKPAQVLMSAGVADSARQRLDNGALGQPVRWQSHGRYALKGIESPVEIREAGVAGVASFIAPAQPSAVQRWSRRGILVGTSAAGALAGMGVVAWQRGLFGTGPRAGDNSVAVLPFDNLSGDATQTYFSDGVTEEVREALARSPNFQVIAKTSAAQFREHKGDAISIATKLGVAFLLDGSVRRAANVVRIGAELIDGRSGFSRWSQSFDRRLTDVFKIQSDIATAVTAALSAQIGAHRTPANSAQVNTSGGTANIVAYDAYLRGRAQYQLSADEAGMRAALQQFDNAIAADAQFANAHAARALCLMSIANQYAATQLQAGLYAAALTSAQRAVAIAPDLAAAQSTLGAVLFQGLLDARAARAPFARARVLGAGEAVVLGRVALYAAHTGKNAEAAAAIEHAVLLDPLNPLVRLAAASVAYAARGYQASIAPAQLALSMNPRMPHAHALIGDALLMLGKPHEAAAAYAAEPVPDYRLAGQAIAAQRRGNLAAARELLRELERQAGDAALYQQAQVLAQLGERDAAITRLQQARALGDSGLVYARNDPLLDPLRRDARFVVLLKGIGFE